MSLVGKVLVGPDFFAPAFGSAVVFGAALGVAFVSAEGPYPHSQT